MKKIKTRFLKEKAKDLKRELGFVKSARTEQDYFKKRSDRTIGMREEEMRKAKNQAFDTVALWGLYGKEDMERYKSLTLPLFLTTAGSSYDSLVDGELLLSYKTTNDPNKIYSRIDNVTVDHLALKFAALEGLGIPQLTQGLCTSSGMAATLMATTAFLNPGDNFVSSNRVYGGTQQLFDATYPKFGWNVRWVQTPWDLKGWEQIINKKTKFLFLETPSNPTLFVADIPALARLAHSHNIPLIVDSTFASPALTRPLEYGADIVLHSISKIANGSCRAIGGVIIAKDKIMTNQNQIQKDFVHKLKGSHFRNMGPCLSPYNAMVIWDEMGTLRIRIKELGERAMKIAEFLEGHPMIEKVHYPGLKSHPQHAIAKRLMKLPDGIPSFGFMLSFETKGGLEKAKKFAEIFDFGVQVTHLGGNYTVWVHNATTTHSQMGKSEREKVGITDGLIRYSVGLEGAEDAIKSLDKALKQLGK